MTENEKKKAAELLDDGSYVTIVRSGDNHRAMIRYFNKDQFEFFVKIGFTKYGKYLEISGKKASRLAADVVEYAVVKKPQLEILVEMEGLVRNWGGIRPAGSTVVPGNIASARVGLFERMKALNRGNAVVGQTS